MDRQYFQTLENENLVEVACNLRNFAAELIERLEQDSGNSSKPPSSDDPFKKGSDTEDKKIKEKNKNESDKEDVKRSPGKQPGAEGFWRSPVPEAEEIIVHCPENCAACNRKIQTDEIYSNPYMGHYVFELEKMTSGIRMVCTLHHYYGAACKCGHETKERPGEGYISEVEGRKKDLKLTEYTIAG
ncbi:MAG: IS66 family transposase, partial [Desulfobacteraceae bacterium]|nr:IS66 family transposase [Desulfobacteraceae bacterium]